MAYAIKSLISTTSSYDCGGCRYKSSTANIPKKLTMSFIHDIWDQAKSKPFDSKPACVSKSIHLRLALIAGHIHSKNKHKHVSKSLTLALRTKSKWKLKQKDDISLCSQFPFVQKYGTLSSIIKTK